MDEIDPLEDNLVPEDNIATNWSEELSKENQQLKEAQVKAYELIDKLLQNSQQDY